LVGVFTGWAKGRKAIASAVAIVVLVGVPVSLAIIHQGFPVTDVDLNSQNVWVTNAKQLLGGRLNHQIGELDAKVNGSSTHLDVLQDGGATILTDTTLGTVQVVDPAFVSLTQKIAVPVGSQVAYGDNTLAVLGPDGRLWVIDATQRLSFDPAKTSPLAKLGEKSQVVVSKTGTVFATSVSAQKMLTVDRAGDAATSKPFAVPGEYQLSVVGNQPILLDTKANVLKRSDGGTTKLGARALRVQQAGPDNTYALVATGTGLLEVPLDGGSPKSIPAKISTPVTSAKGASAPVFLNGCAYGAWSDAQKYLYACDGKAAVAQDIDQPTTGSTLEFRVNHGVIALNNLQNGNAWIVTSNMRLVNNWAQVNPDQVTKDGETGKERPIKQSFEDAVANRTTENHPPVAVEDNFGARPGRTAVLPVLDNDTDEDGDVLTISAVDALPAAQGRIDVIEGGRALQFTAPEGEATSASFRYTITDGRQAYSSAQVNVTIRPLSQNLAPVAKRLSSTNVEVGQQIQYNVLNDFADPDGDEIYLVNATATTPDLVQFSADGKVTFTSKTGQTGSKQVAFTVSDGHATTTGSLEVDVKPADSLDPVAVPDFITASSGIPATLHPLENDVSPSGQPLSLVGAKLESASGGTVTTDQAHSTIGFVSNSPGAYYLTYTVAAGSHTTQGIALVNVTDPSATSAAPIAVNDVAYVRPGEPTTVDVLANDSSPTGRVLVVQSVDKSADAATVNVEVLANSIVRVSAPGVLAQQVQLTYIVSDGVKTSTAGITIVPIPPLVNHQPPVTVDDTVTVRAGDITSVHVLDNDYSPDNEPFTLDPTLAESSAPGTGAIAFVSGSLVRYQAPTTPGTYSAGYTVSDKFNQRASGTVTFVVTAKGGKDRAPEPQSLTGRTFAGAGVVIQIPLDGIDPDGDSVQLNGIAAAPRLGRIIATTPTSFDYEAYGGSAGTDTFSYQVEDTSGKTAVGSISIGVIPRPSTVKSPTAIDDRIEIKPGKTAAVPVLLNDSDPNGYELSLKSKLAEVQSPLKAKVSGAIVLITAPNNQGAYVVRYQVTNGHGGSAYAFVQVLVTNDAKSTYPTAIDHVIDIQSLTGKDSIAVDALDGALNPSGLTSDLKLGVKGPNAAAAVVGANGKITVTPGEHRMAITYSLTDTTTGLAGSAFIVVPAKPGSAEASTAAPRVKPGFTSIVKMNGTASYTLDQILDVPSGRPATITKASDVNATNSSGSSPFVSSKAMQYTAAKDYRGPAAITFKIDDGRDPGTTADRITLLTLQITVGNADQSDVPPTFTPPNEQLQAGEAAQTIDLRDSTYHPNPAILSQVTYSDFKNSNSDVTADASGSKLTMSAPFGVQPGSVSTVTFTVNYGEFHIPGQVNISTVSSTRPLAYQQNAPQKLDFKRGSSGATQSDAVGDNSWINPFPGQALKIIGAKLANSPTGVTVSYTASSISVNASTGAKTGDVNVTYTVQDATKDPARNVTGQLTATIHDVPDAPTLSGATADDARASVTIDNGTVDHGRAISNYVVTASPGGQTQSRTTAGAVTFTGLTNGQSYTFTAIATNSDGNSAPSKSEGPVTPYGTPSGPTNVTISPPSAFTGADLTLRWTAPTVTGGGAVRYEYSVNGEPFKAGSSPVALSNMPNGTYKAQVRAINTGSGKTGPAVDSNSVSVTTKPDPTTVDLCYGDTYSGNLVYHGVQVHNVQAGTYTIWVTSSENESFYHNTYSVPSSGTVQLSSYKGHASPGDRADVFTVHMTGPANYTSSATVWGDAPKC
jgi:hypothetical protein